MSNETETQMSLGGFLLTCACLLAIMLAVDHFVIRKLARRADEAVAARTKACAAKGGNLIVANEGGLYSNRVELCLRKGSVIE